MIFNHITSPQKNWGDFKITSAQPKNNWGDFIVTSPHLEKIEAISQSPHLTSPHTPESGLRAGPDRFSSETIDWDWLYQDWLFWAWPFPIKIRIDIFNWIWTDLSVHFFFWDLFFLTNYEGPFVHLAAPDFITSIENVINALDSTPMVNCFYPLFSSKKKLI